MLRQTIVVGSSTAWHQERFDQTLCNATGIQILTVRRLVERLAGGFLRAANLDELQVACAQALDLEKSKLHHLSPLVELPGTASAVSGTLEKAWASGLDLSAWREEPRCVDLNILEASIISHLPNGALVASDLLEAALARINFAPSLIGSIRVKGVYALAPCWQPLFAALAERIPVVWETTGECDSWVANTQIDTIRLPMSESFRSAVSCANPTHEMTEALRWARELIVAGRAEAQEIAIAAASVEGFDDYLRVMCDESQLPVYFTNGRAALSGFLGQQAAALAELLLHGVSQDRILRSIRLIRSENKELRALPDGWERLINADAPLLKVEHWRHEVARINEEHKIDLRPTLLAFVEDVARESSAAATIGERWLSSGAKAIWRRALAQGPPSALATMLNHVRVADEGDPAASILWGTAAVICTVRRKFVRLVGLSSRGWPRTLQDDPLLPEHILGRRLSAHSVPELDRLYFDVLTGQATEIVFSRSRRDKEGRVLGISPLFPRTIEEVALRQSRVPPHAFSRADRLLARPAEFARSELARSVRQCVEDRNREEITAHDGLVRPDHPVVAAALGRVQSATSLRLLLRDPLGFVWKYALRWKQPDDTTEEEPILFDNLAKGRFIHELLEQTVIQLERDGGFSTASREQIAAAISRACQNTAERWELDVPIPPRAIWEREKNQSREIAFKALTYPHEAHDHLHSFVEVPFGDSATPRQDLNYLGILRGWLSFPIYTSELQAELTVLT